MPALERDDIKRAMRPLAPFFRSAVLKARDVCDVESVAKATPHISRLAHLRRLSGTERWMVIADDLVRRSPEMPHGYGALSTDLDHNRGRYAFQFPMGVFTIRRDPHEEPEGNYIQERLDGIMEQIQLAPDVDAFVGVVAYLSVPPTGEVKVIITHPTLEEPMVVLLDELEEDGGVVVTLAPTQPSPETSVRSIREQEAEENANDES